MGMFDIVIPECPLPDEAARLVEEWQTNTFDEPFMERYRITADGTLQSEVVGWEDRADATAPPGSIASIVGCMTRVHEGWEDCPFTGVLNFYGTTGRPIGHGGWIEYDAHFDRGQLVKIERVPDRFARPTGEPTP